MGPSGKGSYCNIQSCTFKFTSVKINYTYVKSLTFGISGLIYPSFVLFYLYIVNIRILSDYRNL